MVRMGRGARSGRIGRGGGSGAGVGIAGGSDAATGGYFPAVGVAGAGAVAAGTPGGTAMSPYTSPPQPRFIYQTTPTLTAAAGASPIATATASPQFYPTTPTAAYFDATATPKRPGEEQQLNMPVGAAAAALVEVPTGASMGAIKQTKNSVQVGGRYCVIYSSASSNYNNSIIILVRKFSQGYSL